MPARHLPRATLLPMRRPAPLPPSLRAGPFTPAQARSAGIGPGRLRRSDIRRLARGLYCWVDPTRPTDDSGPALVAPSGPTARATPDVPYAWSTPLDAAQLARLDLLLPHRASTALSHVTLARAEGLWLPDRLDRTDALHVSRGRGRTQLTVRGVVSHRTALSSADLRTVEVEGRAWHATTRTRLWLDMAALLRDDELVALGDDLIARAGREDPSRGAAERFLARLLAAIDMTPSCRNHRRRLRAAAARLRVGADSPPETMLRLALIEAGLPEPALQIEVWDPEFSTLRPATADLGYPEARLALHYDGGHHGRDRQIDSDVRRNAAFERRGYRNVVVSSSDRRGGFGRVIRAVREHLASQT